MKKYLYIIFFALSIPCLCFSATGDVETILGKTDTTLSTVIGKASAGIATVCGKNYTDGDGGGCTTSVDSASGTGADYVLGDATNSIVKRSQSFVTSKAYTLCKLSVQIKEAGTALGTLTCSIYADSSNVPTGSPLGTSTNSFTTTEITTSYQTITFTFTGVSLSNATQYHISVETNTVNTGINKFLIDGGNTGTQDICSYISSWSSNDNTATGNFTTYE